MNLEQPHILASWQASDTTIAEVERALAEVRRAEVRAAVRTAVLTLVVLADEEDCAGFLGTVRAMASAHPSHTLVLVTGRPDDPPRCDAEVTVHLLERDGRGVCVEDVLLRLAGPIVAHLDSVVEPFTIADLPVVAWLPTRLPPLDDPLVAGADRVVVDTKELRDVDAFPEVAALVRRLPVVDLSWVRLEPWREILAGLFEGEEFAPFVSGVTRAEVWGKDGPRHLLGGWLASRLALPAGAVGLHPDRHVTIELEAAAGGRRGRFRVARPTDERLIETTVDVEDGPVLRRTLRMRDRSPARVLGLALARTGHDRVYEQALAASIALGAHP